MSSPALVPADQETAEPPIVLHFRPLLRMTDDEFFKFCQQNSDLNLERTAEGDILIVPPVSDDSSYSNADLVVQLGVWAKQDGRGRVYESSAGFTLPNSAVRSPDAAWVLRSRWEALDKAQRRRFAPICPDFVAEVRSPTDRMSVLHAKMREYIENGAQLGWLIEPFARQVFIYRPGTEPERLDHPKTISGDPVLPGFVLDCTELWESSA